MKKGYTLKMFEEFKNIGDEVYVITGFHGFGAVGFLATKYIVAKLQMKLVGYIDTYRIPDFTSVEDYGFSMPHEIFYKDLNNHKKLFVLLNRVNPERKYLTSFINEFTTFINKINASEVILFGGLDIRFRENNEEYRWIKTSACKRVLNAPYFIKGAYIVGPLASVLLSLQQNSTPAIVILPYTQPETADHRAAAIAIKVLSSIIGVEIDVSELVSYAEKIEEIEKTIQSFYEQQVKKQESVMHM